ncbi:hypothetical protein Hamer_G019891 [Homarus americanus]|uniref:Uncharacterized protein n=1 Tax=Homarus americanus TaxID=6706 RepID=A0A8J5JTF5_HOMAM|nr:hypothetical protein Hamer_G019891 [Homarus americanus]
MSMNCLKRKENIKEAQQKATKTSVSPYKAVLPIGTPTPAVTARTYRDVVMVGTPTSAVTMAPAATTDSTVLLNARDRYLHD